MLNTSCAAEAPAFVPSDLLCEGEPEHLTLIVAPHERELEWRTLLADFLVQQGLSQHEGGSAARHYGSDELIRSLIQSELYQLAQNNGVWMEINWMTNIDDPIVFDCYFQSTADLARFEAIIAERGWETERER